MAQKHAMEEELRLEQQQEQHAQDNAARAAARATARSYRTTPTRAQSADSKLLRNSYKIWQKPHDFASMFTGNKQYVKRSLDADARYFDKMKKHKPRFMWIGCADARLSADQIISLQPGEIFVHRNIGNQTHDFSLLSSVEYAVRYLKIKDIVVCGHYDCGAINAALSGEDHGMLSHWITNIRDVYRLHHKEIDALATPLARANKLVECNVLEQAIHLFKNNTVQEFQQKHGWPRIHGVTYDVGKGLLKEIKTDFRSLIKPHKHIYKIKPTATPATTTTTTEEKEEDED
jgi:carbonic anhydrase